MSTSRSGHDEHEHDQVSRSLVPLLQRGARVPIFGWDLSYTKLTLALEFDSLVSDPTEPLVITRLSDANVTVIVSNNGNFAGDEVVFAFFRPLNVRATGDAALLNEQLFDYRRVSLHFTRYHKVTFCIEHRTLAMVEEMGSHVSCPGFYKATLANGVHERVAFAAHVVGAYDILIKFWTDYEHDRSASVPLQMAE